jgi:hypothetical protein
VFVQEIVEGYARSVEFGCLALGSLGWDSTVSWVTDYQVGMDYMNSRWNGYFRITVPGDTSY